MRSTLSSKYGIRESKEAAACNLEHGSYHTRACAWLGWDFQPNFVHSIAPNGLSVNAFRWEALAELKTKLEFALSRLNDQAGLERSHLGVMCVCVCVLGDSMTPRLAPSPERLVAFKRLAELLVRVRREPWVVA